MSLKHSSGQKPKGRGHREKQASSIFRHILVLGTVVPRQHSLPQTAWPVWPENTVQEAQLRQGLWDLVIHALHAAHEGPHLSCLSTLALPVSLQRRAVMECSDGFLGCTSLRTSTAGRGIATTYFLLRPMTIPSLLGETRDLVCVLTRHPLLANVQVTSPPSVPISEHPGFGVAQEHLQLLQSGAAAQSSVEGLGEGVHPGSSGQGWIKIPSLEQTAPCSFSNHPPD